MKDKRKKSLKKNQNSRRVGFAIEEEACRYLEEKGYRIICRNFYSRYGEIDIVAYDEDVLVFIEVRYRKRGSLVRPEESVGFRKIQRLKLAIRDYLFVNAGKIGSNCKIRVDLCSVRDSDQGVGKDEGGRTSFAFKIVRGIIE